MPSFGNDPVFMSYFAPDGTCRGRTTRQSMLIKVHFDHDVEPFGSYDVLRSLFCMSLMLFPLALREILTYTAPRVGRP